MLTLEETRKIIAAEIKWCKEHPDARLSPDFQRGFVAGLMQARRLISKASAGKDYQLFTASNPLHLAKG